MLGQQTNSIDLWWWVGGLYILMRLIIEPQPIRMPSQSNHIPSPSTQFIFCLIYYPFVSFCFSLCSCSIWCLLLTLIVNFSFNFVCFDHIYSFQKRLPSSLYRFALCQFNSLWSCYEANKIYIFCQTKMESKMYVNGEKLLHFLIFPWPDSFIFSRYIRLTLISCSFLLFN